MSKNTNKPLLKKISKNIKRKSSIHEKMKKEFESSWQKTYTPSKKDNPQLP